MCSCDTPLAGRRTRKGEGYEGEAQVLGDDSAPDGCHRADRPRRDRAEGRGVSGRVTVDPSSNTISVTGKDGKQATLSSSAKLKSKGWTIKASMNSADGGGLISSEKGTNVLQIVIAPASGSDAKSTVALTYAPK